MLNCVNDYVHLYQNVLLHTLNVCNSPSSIISNKVGRMEWVKNKQGEGGKTREMASLLHPPLSTRWGSNRDMTICSPRSEPGSASRSLAPLSGALQPPELWETNSWESQCTGSCWSTWIGPSYGSSPFLKSSQLLQSVHASGELSPFGLLQWVEAGTTRRWVLLIGLPQVAPELSHFNFSSIP